MDKFDEKTISEWQLRILHHIYYSFGRLRYSLPFFLSPSLSVMHTLTHFSHYRIKELFDIIVEYPDSSPALHDLRECLEHADIRNELKTSLKAV